MSNAATNRMAHKLRYLLFATPGFAAAAVAMALGAFLASPDNGWESAVFYSAIGLIGAPLATLAWATHRLRRGQIFAGVSLLGGFLASMCLLFEFTDPHPAIFQASARAPFALVSWFGIWGLWIALAIARLIMFTPERTRHRLSKRPSHRA